MVCFLDAMTQGPNRRIGGQKGFILAPGVRMQSIPEGTAWKQELEAAVPLHP